jgi:hypothetical protein
VSYNRSALMAASARGDPFLGGLIKGALKIGSRILPGPAGALAGAAAGLLGGGGRPAAGRPMLAPPAVSLRGGFAAAMPGVGLAGVGALSTRAPGAVTTRGDGCPKGYRLNKTGYFLKSGQYVPPESRCVRIRRMNPANSRALSRGLRREESFIRLARRTGLVALPKARRVRRAARKSH